MFIVIEGSDYAGKTTQIEMLSQYLTESDVDHIVTREPGGTEFAEQVRTLLKTHSLSPAAMMYAILAARIDHIDKVIAPALAAGKVVLCDRFEMSTYVYQVLSDPSLECIFQDIVLPEDPVYIVLSLSREAMLPRIASRNADIDVIEAANANVDLNERYLQAADYFDDCYVVQACQAPHAVHREIRDIVDNLLV